MPPRRSPMSVLNLPGEILAIIINALSNGQKNTCLFINRAFHAAALNQLFSTLHLYLGDWEHLVSDFTKEEVAGAHASTYRRTAEILDHISKNELFASVVRAISVFATAEDGDGHPQWEEPLCLAVRKLPSLHMFMWHGTSPIMPTAVYESLTMRSDTLRTLRLPAQAANAPCNFGKMTKLTTLVIASLRQVDNVGGYWLHDLDQAIPDFSALIVANQDTLRRLTVFDTLLPHIPTRTFAKLLSLEVWGIRASSEEILSPVFENATELEQFTLADIDFTVAAPSFAKYADALPKLRDLKVTSLDPVLDGQTNALVKFLETHPGLHMLDIDIPGMTAQNIRDLAKCFALLKNLEVLGMDTRMLTREEDMEIFAESLPSTLVAMHTQSCWENMTPHDGEIQCLIKAWGRMPKLRYLHIENEFEDEVEAASWLADGIPSLIFLGMVDACWEIWRESPGAEPELEQLSKKEVLERTADEVGDPQWSALMRYHGAFDKFVDDRRRSPSNTNTP